MPGRFIAAALGLVAASLPVGCGAPGDGQGGGLGGLAGGLGVSIPFMQAPPDPVPAQVVEIEVEAIQIPVGPTADDVQLEVSRTIRATLASMGLLTREQIAAWFNEPVDREDPFARAMEEEIRTAIQSAFGAADLADLELSAATRRVLEQAGVASPAELRRFDTDRIAKDRLAQAICRGEIVQRMRMDGWTSLVATVANPARASELSLNGVPFGSLQPLSAEVSRQFLVLLPGDSSDESQIATLSVDVPSSETGLPPARWFRDLELRRRGESRLSISVASAPAPSIGFEPTRRLSPNAVYAGDEVGVFVEGASEDTIWVFVPNMGELDARTYQATPSGSATFSGLAAWFELRSLIASGQSGRRSALAGSPVVSRIVGRGSRIAWTPEFESPDALMVALVQGPDGFWGLASRPIAVADLRPGVFILPDLQLETSPAFLQQVDQGFRSFSPLSIYRTHWALRRLTYVATLPGSVDFDLFTDDLFEASLPLESVSIDFGDGTPPTRLDAARAVGARLSHRYTAPGRYRVSLTSRDSMGFSREQWTTVLVNPAPVAAAPVPPPQARPTPPRPAPPPPVRTVERGVGTFGLLTAAIDRLAESVANTLEATAPRRIVSLAQVLDTADRAAFDLVDQAIVSTLLDRGATVLERDSWFLAGIDRGGLLIADAPLMGGAAGRQLSRGEVVIGCKIRRMEVQVQEVGDLSIRTARILAFVRIHDASTEQILADRLIEIELSDSQSSAGIAPAGTPWNAYPDGYLMRRIAN
jgi:hypothetical protein